MAAMKNHLHDRLEYLRSQIRGECISYSELAELQSLAGHIDPSDVELLEWAGVPEFDTRQRTDGRYEVADTRPANERYGCKLDDWCILANGHEGDCNDDREVWWP